MPVIDMTIDELVGTIKKSRAINIVIEGRDDVVAYRLIEKFLADSDDRQISLFPTGGRPKLLEVYIRLKAENALRNCIFICDKDMWVFTGIPNDFNDDIIVVTDGYSIENDLVSDSPFETLMSPGEKVTFDMEMAHFCEWFAVQAADLLKGRSAEISTFPGLILDRTPREDFSVKLAADEDLQQLHTKIASNAAKFVRGKSLVQVAMRQLAQSGRTPKHHHLAYLEMSAARRGAAFSRIVDSVSDKLVKM